MKQNLAPNLPPIPWHKTRVGFTFLVILSFFLMVFLVFVGLIGYYAWQISRGQGDKIIESLIESDRFSRDEQSKNTVSLRSPQDLIRPENPSIGSTEAPLQMVAFLDFMCPFSSESYPLVEEMLSRYGDDIKFTFKHFPITKNSVGAALGGACAAKQDKFFEFYRAFFETENKDADTALAVAEKIGLNLPLYKNCVAEQQTLDIITQDMKDGRELGVAGTPTFFLNKIKIIGTINTEKWEAAVISALE